MNWQNTGNISLGLGFFAVVIGILLQSKAGRWLLTGILLILSAIALCNGEYADVPDTNDPLKASRYWLIGGGICLLLGLALRSLAYRSI